MHRKIIVGLLILIGGWYVTSFDRVDAVEDYWWDNCEVNPDAERYVFIDENGDRVYHNVYGDVLWEISNDFCVSLDLIVAYNFILVPREPIDYAYIKLPPGPEKLGWFPGKSFFRPNDISRFEDSIFFEITPPNRFAWPVYQGTGAVSQLYHSAHHGLDISTEVGTHVLSIANGEIVRIEQDHHVLGKLIVVDHGNDILAVYAHLSEIFVKKNQVIAQGQLIAYSGNSGRSSAPHLHLEIRETFRFTDPCKYLYGCPETAYHGPREETVSPVVINPTQPHTQADTVHQHEPAPEPNNQPGQTEQPQTSNPQPQPQPTNPPAQPQPTNPPAQPQPTQPQPTPLPPTPEPLPTRPSAFPPTSTPISQNP